MRRSRQQRVARHIDQGSRGFNLHGIQMLHLASLVIHNEPVRVSEVEIKSRHPGPLPFKLMSLLLARWRSEAIRSCGPRCRPRERVEAGLLYGIRQARYE